MWPALWTGKMDRILCCEWLPEWARWSYRVYLACSRLPTVSWKKNFSASHILNPSLTKLVCQDGWILVSFLFWRVYGPRFCLCPYTRKKTLGQYPAILTSHLIYNPYILHKDCNVCCKLCGCGACPKEMFKIVLILAIFIIHVLYKSKLTWMKEGHSQSCKGFGCDL